MCGIFAIINALESSSSSKIKLSFEKGKNRGPEYSKLQHFGDDVTFGFHRLAINGLNEASHQPLLIDDVALICNGEIYNYRQLYENLQITPTTGSDCEVIIHLYRRFGIESTLKMLDGVFSFVLYDMKTDDETESNKIFFARDPLGVRPLYIIRPLKEGPILVASELKVLTDLYDDFALYHTHSVQHFVPGTWSSCEKSLKALDHWREVVVNQPYFLPVHFENMVLKSVGKTNQPIHLNYVDSIQQHLVDAVAKRYLATERPIACLLSGGLDSSLIAALVCEINCYVQNLPYKESSKRIETYSIGLANSEDLKFARMVAEHLGTKHTEIVVTEHEMISSIPEVIYAIESYDTTSVRASVGNYLLGKYIAAHSDAKVIFNGDGSDELCGGYLYMRNAPDCYEFDNECRRLLKDIHLFDVLRSDKCISSHGLEPRTPFLDKAFVNAYLSIHPTVRMPAKSDCEKMLLRTCFSKAHFKPVFNEQLLPSEVLWRRKEAFSDGVSSSGGRSWYQIVQEFCNGLKLPDLSDVDRPPKTAEQAYYRHLFLKSFPRLSSIVPYFWMPKYVEGATDPSARTLEVYQQQEQQQEQQQS